MDSIVTWAEGVLGRPIHRTASLLPEGRRSRVLRCFTAEGSLILKQAPDAREFEGLMFLQGTGLAPTCVAGDPERGLVLMEDLLGERLDALLLRPDEPEAEARLMQLAEALGRVHALPVEPGPTMTQDVDRICAAWDIESDTHDRRALALEATAYTQGDVGPDNAMVCGGAVRLFDFEMGAPRHPLTDAVAWHMGFPYGADTGAIPTSVVRAMDQAYKNARGTSLDPHDWHRAYVHQLLGRLDRFDEWSVRSDDWTWGRASGRQRILALLASRPSESPLARGLANLEDRLRTGWPDVPVTLPTFPALLDV